MSTKIEWATRVWNPVTGCTKVSPGCANCYAERFAKRLQANPKVNGKYVDGFQVIMHWNELNRPLLWNKRERIFVCSMGDLFHDDVDFDFIKCVMKTIHDKPTHTFIILTKRAERMAEFFKWLNNSNLAVNFPNMWLGVSVENQEQAQKRIPYLLRINSAVRFVSCEPLLSDIDFTDITIDCQYYHTLGGYGDINPGNGRKIDWVIVGGESGPKARPMHPDWVRSIRDQCICANVPFFFKSWGDYYTKSILMTTKEPHFRGFSSMQNWINKAQTWVRGGKCISIDGTLCEIGKHFAECAYPVAIMDRVGKKYSGRLLDGKEYSEFPKAQL